MTELTYLDHASTSYPKPDAVWEAARDYLADVGASPGRGGYRAARRADALMEEARGLVAALIGATDSSRVVFTANATEALNVAITGSLSRGDHVVTTSAEHNSVLRPLEALARAREITYTVVEVGAGGLLDPAAVRAAMTPATRLVAVNHASNVTGAVAPAAAVGALAREAGALFLLDASQTLGVLDVDVDALGVDLLAFTGHKGLRGPSGTGGLYVRRPAALRPLLHGGTGLNSSAPVQPAVMPAKFEAGTPNYLGVAGLRAAVRELLAEGVENVREREARLTELALRGLRAVDGLTVYDVDPRVARVPVVSVNLAGWYPAELCAVLDEQYGVLTRAGLHCAPLMHRTLGTSPHGTLRVSLGAGTTERDVEALCDALAEIRASSRQEVSA
jgi:cysteine desulfurase family protein